jgi:hypothetical protein
MDSLLLSKRKRKNEVFSFGTVHWKCTCIFLIETPTGKMSFLIKLNVKNSFGRSDNNDLHFLQYSKKDEI